MRRGLWTLTKEEKERINKINAESKKLLKPELRKNPWLMPIEKKYKRFAKKRTYDIMG